jgi:peptide deformylase
MAILPILTYPHPTLKTEAKPVEAVDDRIQALAEDLVETMYDAPGAGLAAPQVGESCRMIVVETGDADIGPRPLVVVNPKIIDADGEFIFEEGCLSVLEYTAKVNRAENVVVEGLDVEGQPLRIEASGRLAVVFQHEIDHLDGVLFIDRISRLKRNMYLNKLKKIIKRREEEAAAAG